jgi:hypothetical protein
MSEQRWRIYRSIVFRSYLKSEINKHFQPWTLFLPFIFSLGKHKKPIDLQCKSQSKDKPQSTKQTYEVSRNTLNLKETRLLKMIKILIGAGKLELALGFLGVDSTKISA